MGSGITNAIGTFIEDDIVGPLECAEQFLEVVGQGIISPITNIVNDFENHADPLQVGN